MIGTADAVANVAVKDLDRAKSFYEETLGLSEIAHEGDEQVTMKSGNTTLSIYRSDYAGTNKATAVTWAVPDIAVEVDALKEKGVMFQHYDLPGLTREGDVHVGGGMKVAWFTDPDGNILNLVEG